MKCKNEREKINFLKKVQLKKPKQKAKTKTKTKT
jgi:hypothetical protein